MVLKIDGEMACDHITQFNVFFDSSPDDIIFIIWNVIIHSTSTHINATSYFGTLVELKL